jgi:hypothetical protein
MAGGREPGHEQHGTPTRFHVQGLEDEMGGLNLLPDFQVLMKNEVLAD